MIASTIAILRHLYSRHRGRGCQQVPEACRDLATILGDDVCVFHRGASGRGDSVESPWGRPRRPSRSRSRGGKREILSAQSRALRGEDRDFASDPRSASHVVPLPVAKSRLSRFGRLTSLSYFVYTIYLTQCHICEIASRIAVSLLQRHLHIQVVGYEGPGVGGFVD